MINNKKYLMLGIPESTSLVEIKQAYSELLRALYEADCQCTCGAVHHVRQARQKLSEILEEVEEFANEKSRENKVETEFSRPKLGQLLVTTGLISTDELDSCLEIQRNTKTEHIPVGEIFVACGYISQQQLDYYLALQRQIELPSDRPDRWGQRLVELGMVSEDQLKVALVEQKTTGCTLRQALINRGWLSSEVLDRIF